MNTELEPLQTLLNEARREIGKVVLGQSGVIDQCLTVIFSGQHALLEGVPGVGKTLLVNTLAKVLGCEFQRIQMTPDLMPADIIGTNVFNMKEHEFTLVKGPVFTSFLLADEINRAPAKTQSALLQAMQERSVAIDREIFRLDPAFTVFATQNPVEHEGTYPLPEAQKDRFMLKIHVTYPDEDTEIDLAGRFLEGHSPESVLKDDEVRAVLPPGELLKARAALGGIAVQPELVRYAAQVIRTTRDHEHILVGASPRATVALLLGARVYAVLDGREYVIPDDIKALVPAVLDHRLILRPEFEIEGLTVTEVIQEILRNVTVPR
ncbi:MAG: MoxR family ATPase [Verrucomicrobia bacterium]|nr:MoxR family ATPase [Verrucomicrobiota bacterium]MCH8526482.1 MoxR family ATPase [Kiritimatiellia bacterium]